MEFFGWTFLDVDSWVATADDQDRIQFTLGGVGSHGTIAVADPDEYNDGDISIDPDQYNASLATPPIPLDAVEPGTVAILYDSSWRGEDSQKATLEVSIDGGVPIELFRWTSDPMDDHFKPDATNETITLPMNNPPDAGSIILNGQSLKSETTGGWPSTMFVSAAGSIPTRMV